MRGRPKAPPGCYWPRNSPNTLWARIYISGREIRRSLHTDDPKVAKTRRGTLKAKLTAIKLGDAEHNFEDVLEQWLEWIPHQVSASTEKRYLSSLDQLRSYLAGTSIGDIDGKLIAGIIRDRQSRDGVTNATLKRDLGALSSVMNFAVDQGWREDNPVLPRLKRIKEKRDAIFLPDLNDVQRVVQRAPGLFADLIAAALATGCRQEELASACRFQLDLKAQRLTLIGKGKKIRVIDLAPFDGLVVFAGLPASVAKAPLFWHGSGERYANVASRFAFLTKEIAAANPNFTRFRFHDLRHLHAVMWLRDGRSIYDLRDRLGHRNISTTEQYLRFLTPEEVRRVKGTDTRIETGTEALQIAKAFSASD